MNGDEKWYNFSSPSWSGVVFEFFHFCWQRLMFLTQLFVCIILHTLPETNSSLLKIGLLFCPKRSCLSTPTMKHEKNCRGQTYSLGCFRKGIYNLLGACQIKTCPQTFGVKIPKNLWETTGHGNDFFSINKTNLEDRNLTLWRPFGAGHFCPFLTRFHRGGGK